MSVAEVYGKGHVTFMGVELLVARGTLVPRKETELLGQTALAAIRGLQVPAARVVDMCCGCGNLACAIAHHAANAEVWASDLTDPCIEAARRNVLHLGLSQRVRIFQGDLFAGLQGLALEGSVDAVVCNPPYISGRRLEGDRAHLLAQEPREAFDGGPFGLSIHQRVLKDALAFLRPGAALLFEIGLGQDRQVKTLFERSGAYEDIHLVTDAVGNARVALGRKKAH